MDERLADQLAIKLGERNVFYDKWNLEAGQLLPEELTKGISESKWFIVLASKNAMESRWIKYEINLAIIRWIKDENYRIVVARIDECEIHPELQPFVYIDCPGDSQKAIERIVDLILIEGRGIVPKEEDWRKAVVDRHKELESIETVSLGGIRIIFLWGTYGIGKTTLAEHAANQIFGKRISRFYMTEGHDYLRLALELSARAKIKLPDPNASDDELLIVCIESISELIRQGYIIFFDDVELATDEEGKLKDFFSNILIKIAEFNNIPPIFAASVRSPKLEDTLMDITHPIRIGPLGDNYILSCLERWVKLAEPGKESPSQDQLMKVIKELHGYPLAARLASYVIVKYSLEETISDLSHFKDIRIDMAKQLIGRSRMSLTPLQMKILEVLAVANTGLSQYDISRILNTDINEIRVAIDHLFSSLFISIEQGKLQVLPLMKDYFWHLAFTTGSLKKTSMNTAYHARNMLPTCERRTEDFIHYLSMAYRLLVFVGKYDDAHDLAYHFKGELKEAATKLYYTEEYELSLKYINIWLSIKSQDKESKWLKARCLTRLERFDEAEKELQELKKLEYANYKLAHAWGLLYRQKGEQEKALIYFKNGLDDRPDYVPLLRDYGEALERTGDLDLAYEILNQAYSIAPSDPYIAPRLVIVIEKMGKIDDALTIMKKLIITFPDEASFYHRISMLYSAKGDFTNAYVNAKKAVGLDEKLHEAVMHLAAMELQDNNISETHRLLEKLPSNLPLHGRRIRDTIFAEMNLKEQKYNEARRFLKEYKFIEDSYCADILARIELHDATYLISKGNIEAGRNRIKKGLEIVKSTLKEFPNNFPLTTTRNRLEGILKSIEKGV